MDAHALSPFGSDLKACILEASRTWHVQNEFSDCRCDTVCICTMTTFPQVDGRKIKFLSSSQNSAPRLEYLSLFLNFGICTAWAGLGWCDLSGRFFLIHDISLYEIKSVQTRISKFE